MGQTSSNWMPVGIATVFHFLVDGLCLCCLYLMAEDCQSATGLLPLFLTYNILAFMTQPLTGWWVDRLHKASSDSPLKGKASKALFLAIGLLTSAVVLLAGADALDSQASSTSQTCLFLLVAILLGMGNSLFHVWGGKLTASLTGNDMRALGVFVSTGVVGLTVGMVYASWWLMAGMLLLIIILSPAPYLLSLLGGTSTRQPSLQGYSPKWGRWLLLLVLAFVLLRSFVGEVIPTGLEKTPNVLLLLAVTAMMGKAIGGWVARWWGIGSGIVACVGIAAACLMWREADSIPLLPIAIGVFAINCTMPMTLHLANRLLPWREGLSFGLLAAVLIPGYMLAKSLDLSSDHHFMLSALLLTIAVEVGMLMLMGEKRKDVLVGAVAVNILTNVPLNYFLLTYGNSTGRLATGELLVLLVEAVWYYLFVRQWQKAAIYSLLCNATSFLFGVLLQYIIIYSF